MILALIWSIPALGLASVATPEQTLGLWIILSTIMAASAIAFAGIPLATVCFLGVLGLSICVTLGFSAQPWLLLAVVVFTGALIYGCLLRGHSLATMRMDEIAIDERDETVSLLLREFEDHGADWLWEIDSARRVTHASPRFAHALGHPAADLNGKPILELLAGETWEAGNFSAGLRAFAEKLKSREPFRDILLPVKVNGEERWWELSASPRIDARGNFLGLRGVGSDVTEARQSADKINRMARFDTLTGLPNRLMIHETLARAMSEAEQWGSRSAFFMIDLDRFKAVNDTLGHPVGDRLLSRVSERLAQIMSDNELCGRLGGDEFAVVVRDASDRPGWRCSPTASSKRCRAPMRSISTPSISAPRSASRSRPRDGRTAETLIRSADLALYRSKDAGGGVFHAYEPQLHVQAEERRMLEISLRQALKRGEMHLAYQPIVSAEDGSLEGFETLLRWTHPELGVVSPAKFIPVAEDARLIAPIGEWVLRTACEEATRWPNHTRVSVNVSRRTAARSRISSRPWSRRWPTAACPRTGWSSKSPKACSCAKAPARCRCSNRYSISASGWRSTISAPAIPRSAIWRARAFPRSRSIARSSRARRRRCPNAWRSSAPSSRSPARSAWRPLPKGWRTRRNMR